MFSVNSEDDGNKRLSFLLILKFGLSWISMRANRMIYQKISWELDRGIELLNDDPNYFLIFDIKDEICCKAE